MDRKKQTILLHPKAPTILKFSLYFVLIFGLILLVNIIGLATTRNSSFAVLTIYCLFQVLFSILAGVVTRRGRHNLGLWLLLLILWTSVPVYSFQIASLGWFGLISVPLVSILIIEQSLEDRKQIRQLILVSIIFGLASLITGRFQWTDQLPLTGITIAIPVLFGTLIPILSVGAVREFQNYTLRTKLLVFFMGVSTVPLLILGFYNFQATQTGLIDSANQSLFTAAEDTSDEIDGFFESTLNNLQSETRLSALRAILNLSPEDRTAVVEAEAISTLTILENKDSQNIIAYYLLDREGNIVASYPPFTGQADSFLGFDIDTVSFLKTAMLTDIPHISSIRFDTQNRTSSFYLAARVSTETGQPLGLLVAQYDVGIFQELIAKQNGLAGPQSYALLLDEQAMILGHGDRPDFHMRSLDDFEIDTYLNLRYMHRIPDDGLQDLSIHYRALAEELNFDDQHGRAFSVASLENPNLLDQAAIASVDSRPWDVVFVQPQSIFLAPIQTQGRIAIAIISIFAVMVVLSATGATQFLANPIVNLTEVAEKFSSGSLDTLASVATTDEIGSLGQSLNSMAVRLREMISSLEEQVKERTFELERQANQIQVAAEVARDSISETNLTRLLNNTVGLISERFGFYHAGVFLIDDQREYAILHAANSQGGKKMLENRHMLKVGEEGLVGFVTSTGKPRIALDVGEDAVHFRNPFLPQTRSEMCIPLIVGGQVIGALDVQSKHESAFDEKDIAVLEIVADQLGIAIQNATLLANMERALSEAEIASGRYTEVSWSEFVQSQRAVKGYKLDALGMRKADSIPKTSQLALQSGDVVQMAPDKENPQVTEVAIPIRLRNQIIGVINLAFDGSGVDVDTLEMVSIINDRLAIALENARLLDETRQRANLERIAGNISNRIRSTLDIDTVLETTLREIQQSLGVDEVEARLGVVDPGNNPMGSGPQPQEMEREEEYGQ